MYKFFHDPAHGWLEVDIQELQDLNIDDKISSYSYQSEERGKAYIEEDCDLTVFLTALFDCDYPGLELMRDNVTQWFKNNVDDEYLPNAGWGNIPHYIRNCEAYGA